MAEVTLDPIFFAQLKEAWGDRLQVKGKEVWVNVDPKPWEGSMGTVSNGLEELNGYSVKAERTWSEQWPKPRYLYFVYMRIQREKPVFYVRHFYEKIPDGVEDILKFEEEMLYKVRSYWNNNMVPVQSGFDNDFQFGQEPCYVSFVLDEELWKFHPFPFNEFEETVVFRKSKLVSFGDDGTEGARIEFYEPNYSFFNFQRYSIQARGSDGRITERQGFRFQNFMKKDKDGIEKADLPQRICMDIYVRVPMSFHDDRPDKYLTLVYDPPRGSPGPPL